MSNFFLSTLYLSYHFNFSFDTENLPLFVTVAILLHYQSPVIYRSRKVEGNLVHKMNYHYYCHFPGLEFMQLPDIVEGLPIEGQGDG